MKGGESSRKEQKLGKENSENARDIVIVDERLQAQTSAFEPQQLESSRKERSSRKNRSPLKVAQHPTEERVVEGRISDEQVLEIVALHAENVAIEERPKEDALPSVPARRTTSRKAKVLPPPKRRAGRKHAVIEYIEDPVEECKDNVQSLPNRNVVKEVGPAKKRGRPPKQCNFAGAGIEDKATNEQKSRHDNMPEAFETAATDSAQIGHQCKDGEVNTKTAKEEVVEELVLVAITTEQIAEKSLVPSTLESANDVRTSKNTAILCRTGRATKPTNYLEHDQDIAIEKHDTVITLSSLKTGETATVSEANSKRKRRVNAKKPFTSQVMLKNTEEDNKGAGSGTMMPQSNIVGEDSKPQPKHGRPKRPNETVDSLKVIVTSVIRQDEDVEPSMPRVSQQQKESETQPSNSRRTRKLLQTVEVIESQKHTSNNSSSLQGSHADHRKSTDAISVSERTHRSQALVEMTSEVASHTVASEESIGIVAIQLPRRRGRPPKVSAAILQNVEVQNTRPRCYRSELPTIIESGHLHGNQDEQANIDMFAPEAPAKECIAVAKEQTMPTEPCMDEPARVNAVLEPIRARKRGRPPKKLDMAKSSTSAAGSMKGVIMEIDETEKPQAKPTKARKEPRTAAIKPSSCQTTVEQVSHNVREDDEACIRGTCEPKTDGEDAEPTGVNPVEKQKAYKSRGRRIKAVFEDEAGTGESSLEQTQASGPEHKQEAANDLKVCNVKMIAQEQTVRNRKVTNKRQRDPDIVLDAASKNTDTKIIPSYDTSTTVEQRPASSPEPASPIPKPKPLQQRSANMPSPTKKQKTNQSASLGIQKSARPFPMFQLSTRRGRITTKATHDGNEWVKEDWFEARVPVALLRGTVGKRGGVDGRYLAL